MKVAFISLGCAKNLVNTEQMMALCRKAGHTVTGDPEGADVAVLNTCGFIESAKSEAIANILELAQLKDEGKLKKLLVAGCLTQRYPTTSVWNCLRWTVCWVPAAIPMWLPPWKN